jgi:hypothetical protein
MPSIFIFCSENLLTITEMNRLRMKNDVMKIKMMNMSAMS